jgi:hypothetical protein
MVMKLMFGKEELSNRINNVPVLEKEMVSSVQTTDFKAGKTTCTANIRKIICEQKLQKV